MSDKCKHRPPQRSMLHLWLGSTVFTFLARPFLRLTCHACNVKVAMQTAAVAEAADAW